MGASGSCCNGVRDEERMATKLDLSHCGWTEVPPVVYQVERYIETLNLSHNRILSLPPQLFHCQELKHVNLIDNGLDSLPPAIGSLIHLVSLKLDKNCIKDLPENIKNCRKLKRLSLSNNHIQQLPAIVTQLINLEELYLNDCDLTFLPASVGRLTKLKILELRNNRLGNLPLSMNRLTSLTRLDLGDNSLESLPDCIASMAALIELLLDNNDLETMSGAGLRKLEHLDVSYNNLRSISKDIGQCTALTLLNLGWNYLESLPDTIASLTVLEIMILEMNELAALPRIIGKLTGLEELNVANNRLCDLPPTIGLLRNLRVLNLTRNYVQEMPCEIGSCTKLSIINASYNRLQSLPAEVGYLNNLKVLDVVGNFLMYLPISMSNLNGLRAIWLSANQNVPLIPFTEELSVASGERFLTNIALPQMGETALPPPEQEPVVEKTSWRRKIRFEEDEDVLPGRLDRTPTPFPKELRCPAKKQQRQEDNYVNVADGKVALFQQATQQPPSMLSYSDSSVTMIKEANIRRRARNIVGVNESTETDPYDPENNYSQYEKRENCQNIGTAVSVDLSKPSDSLLNTEQITNEGDYGKEEPKQRDESEEANSSYIENKVQSESHYASNRQFNGLSTIDEEDSPKSHCSRGVVENDCSHFKTHQTHAQNKDFNEETEESCDKPVLEKKNIRWSNEVLSNGTNSSEEGALQEVNQCEDVNAKSNPNDNEINIRSEVGAVECIQQNEGRILERRRSHDGSISEKCQPKNDESFYIEATENLREQKENNAEYGQIYGNHGHWDSRFRVPELASHRMAPPDVTLRSIPPQSELSDRFSDRADVESVDSFESERLRGSIVEPMEANRNQVIYSNLKNGNIYPLDLRTYQNPGYMTPPHHTYVNREENVPYSNTPPQSRNYGLGTSNGIRPQAQLNRQSPYGTVRQSPYHDIRNSPMFGQHPSMMQQFVIRQSPYGTIRQSPHLENGNVTSLEGQSKQDQILVMDRSGIYNSPSSFQAWPSPNGMARYSPQLENGNIDMERPPSKQEMLDIAERNRRENIPPPCYEIAKLYSTKAALFENLQRQS